MKKFWIFGGVAAVLSSVACGGGSRVTAPSAVDRAASASVAGAATTAAVYAVGEVPFRGTFSGVQTVTPLPPFPPTSAAVAVSVAGTGTQIVATFTGQAIVGPIVSITERATIVSGTGRFAGASGWFTIVREFVQAEGTTAGTFDGIISAPGAARP